MSDDPERKRSMREQVEEYKRKQREAAQEAGDFRPAHDEGGDCGPDNEQGDKEEWGPPGFVDPEARVKEALERGPNVGRIVGIIFTFVGLILLATSGTILYFTQASLAAEMEAPRIVIRNELWHHEKSSNSSSSSRGSTDLWHPVVEFKLADGPAKTVEMASGGWPKEWDEGDTVTVRYDPAKPLKARIGGDFGMDYFPSILTGFLGFVFFIVGASVWRFLGKV